MPRRIRDYLDRLSHRNTHREEPNTYTVNTTVNMNDWARWNTTQWFPNNEDTPARVHDIDDVAMYIEYTPYWNSNRTIAWNLANNLSGHVEYRRGKIIRIKRYCKI